MRLLPVWLTNQGTRSSLAVLRLWIGLDWIPFSRAERWSRVRCDSLDGGYSEKVQRTCD